MKILRLLGMFGVIALAVACGSDGDDTASTTPTTTTPTAASADEDAAPDDTTSETASDGTLTIDGEEYDVVLGDEVVLSSWPDQAPRDPCALDGDSISVVLLHEGDGGRFIFVAEGPSATELSLTLVDEAMMLDYEAEGATATVGAGTFDYSGTLDGPPGPLEVQVAVTC